MGSTYDPNLTDLDTVNAIYALNKEQASVLLLRFIGYRPKEIVKILRYKNIGKYYRVNYSLRIELKKIKNQKV